MSHLVGQEYAYFQHKNAHKIKEVQHTSKKIIFFGFMYPITTHITKNKQTNKNCNNQLLIIVYSPEKKTEKKQKKSTRADQFSGEWPIYLVCLFQCFFSSFFFFFGMWAIIKLATYTITELAT